ncbi:hypothetical protein KP79_PYT14796 [Mizuhopecten yessoensis]|uniref:C-type lectin domain-containing protein n=1 Tax=Mizuhopecten yessoensis TaxID=6573 RepID=A0A210QI25_MIZYE|nr:hypothetical protein KP79_PYT14796 [Mizuhopecten yessoensis]
MLLIFSLFINHVFSLPICEHNLQNTLNTSQCSSLHVSSVREITNHAWKGTRELIPGVEYWTDVILEFTPWIQFSGCLETSKPQNVLEKSGTRLSDEHPITECLTYMENSTFYLWGSRCVDQKSVGTLTGGHCLGVPFNLTTFCLTGHGNCVCRYDIVALPTEPGLQNCKSVSFSLGEGDSNTLNTALHNVNCDSKLPFLCVGRDNYRKKVGDQFKFFEEELYNISIARKLCSLQHLDIASTVGIQYMSNDFRNHFINNSRSYWTSIFRENRFILGGDRHVYDHDTSNCISVMFHHNQTVVWNVRSCPLVISNDMNCTQATNTIDGSSNVTSDIISKPNQNKYFWFLSVPVVAVIVIVGCLGRRQWSKKTSGHSYTESTRIHYTEPRVRGTGEERADAEYLNTIETRPTQMEAMTSLREPTPISHDQQEEPHYMIMKRPVESIYISLHLKYPTNSAKNAVQK